MCCASSFYITKASRRQGEKRLRIYGHLGLGQPYIENDTLGEKTCRRTAGKKGNSSRASFPPQLDPHLMRYALGAPQAETAL